MGLVETFSYKQEFLDDIKRYKYGLNWPVVYIIRNDKEAYVGESTRVYNRSLEHLKNKERLKLDTIHIVSDYDFNKSVTLEFESKLIEYMAADGKYILQNGNAGLRKQNYYNRMKYEEKFEDIWNELKEKDIVVRGLFEIRNSDLFKYSPYKSLTNEQYEVVESIVKNILSNEKSNNLIQGEPGTGKTIVAIYLLKYLVEREETKDLKIGLVVPMTSLRSTLKKVFRSIKNLKSSMVLGPSEVVGKDYDILIVDEAHRLSRRVNISYMGTYDKCNRKLGLTNDGDQLDWIRLSTKHMVLCYDKNQSIKPSDVRPEKFQEIEFTKYKITSQMRVLAGEDYIKYIENILNQSQKDVKSFGEYELFIFDDFGEMHKTIKAKDKRYGLCRMIAGYAWQWKTQKNPEDYDIVIGENKLRWNSTSKDWINSKNAINEVGCIHTTQGYDINYAGIILGNEIVYRNNKIEIIKENYYDKNGKRTITDENELKKYIINIYKTILTRGIRGTYIYICDEELRNYFKRYIKTFTSDYAGMEKDIIKNETIEI
ncbi:DNA/RNA helicase domain-containing protein [uncultured Clostridium sp.]|uniref:DNA/RNA helicase domain-containing protein n=1 Tax=uncultured Clostridium sp. TaxID=59620 RepID=UPI0025DCEF36|nr:DNA/RNA helicase domain-containing protein [uncultured Clostridium sp.]